MPEAIPETLQAKIEERLRYYEDLGIGLFYRDRTASAGSKAASTPTILQEPSAFVSQESSLPKPKSNAPMPVAATPAVRVAPVMAPTGPSLFEAVEKVKDDTLLKIREDLGDCTPCKLHKGRNKIVFGDCNPKAELV